MEYKKFVASDYKSGAIDLTGRTFGRLRALGVYGKKHREILWYCECECGNKVKVRSSYLRNGVTQSCGCYSKDNPSRRTHNMSRSKIYNRWFHMIERCRNPQNANYHNYGGRGITVCEEWKNFENYYNDVGEPPFDGAELDRVDNNKGYSPDNCRWVTRTINVRNSRAAKHITVFGQTKTAPEWAEIYHIDYKLFLHRLSAGWSAEKALTHPVRVTKNTVHYLPSQLEEVQRNLTEQNQR